jgi:hypothetical protein
MRSLIFALALAASVARAQGPSDPRALEARALFERGRELADHRRFSEAAESFSRSLELVSRPSTLYNLGSCLYALGRHVEAIAMFERYLAEGDPVVEGTGIADAERMLAHARRSVTELTIELEPADARLSIDGVEVEGGATRARTVNPGPHVVRAEADGHAPQLIELEASGDPIRRAIHLVSTRAPGTLIVHVPDRTTATIRVDGREAGRGSATLTLDAGPHVVEIDDDNASPYRRDLALDWNERLRLDVTMQDREGLGEAGSFWLGFGGSVVLAGLLVLFTWLGVEESSPDGGTTGVVLRPRAIGRGEGP